ncbi:MAG: hypothetical protein V3T17_00520 [Pseudomonadales bacterium]
MSYVDNPLEGKYEEFLELIEILCTSYDHSETDIISLSISTAIRVLLHDTNNSISLLAHLGKKDIAFLSTNFTNDKDLIHLGLVRKINVGVSNGIGGEVKYWPLCDERYFSSPKEQHRIQFEQWWNTEEIFCSGKSKLTRKDLVLSMANKDGGAHFDTKVQEKYDNFRYKWSGGSTLVGTKSGISRGYDNIPVYPAIRQIGHEILCTLKP